MFILDKKILDSFNKKQFPRQQTFWKIMADARLLAFFLYGIQCVLLLLKKEYIPILGLSASTVICLMVGYGLKAIVLRPRPHNLVTYLGKFDSSFPSLHTLCAFNLAFQLAIFFPTVSILWFLIATLIGMARMYVQVHYFTDVIGGFVLGLLISTLTQMTIIYL